MQFAKCFGAMLILASIVGCGPAGDTPIVGKPVPVIDSIKENLTDISTTGVVGSGMMNLGQDIETLKSTDAAKADALKKGYDELMALQDPAAITAKAQEMLSKL